MSSIAESSNDSPDPYLPLWARLGLALGAGLLLTGGYALHPLWWAPWLAPALLIPAAAGSWGRAWLAGAVAGAVSMVSVITYYIHFTVITALIVLALRILAWSGAAALTRSAWRRLPPAMAVFVLPVFVAALEELTLTLSVHGAVGSLAYSQMPLLPVIQAAAWGGTPAVTFLVLLPGSLIGGLVVELMAGRLEPKRALAPVVLAMTVLAIAGAYSVIRLREPAPAESLPVALIASDRFSGIASDWKAVWAVYGPAVDHAATPGALVVLPEKIALLDRAAADAAAAEVRTAAMKARATLVVGLEVRTNGIYRNQALVAQPDGQLAWYDKQRLVPFFEARDVPGQTPLFFQTGHIAAGAAVCKDMHIPSIGREYAGKVAVLAVPAWDFGRDGWMGARMTAMRGIEGGYAIARSSRNGLAGAYDAHGRVIAEAPSRLDAIAVTARLPAGRMDTVYSHIGEAFGWLCAALSVMTMVWVRWPRKPAE